MYMLDEGVLGKMKPLIELRMYAYGILNRIFLEEPTRSFLEILKADQFLELFPFKRNIH
jgi:hypothetical protein